jgi:acetyl-CoA carboxylase carboxyl transferase subunit alpha
MMLQYSTYSVISPEGCASILWKSADRAPDAAEALGITSERLRELGLIDRIIPEPLGGAHRDPAATAANVREALLSSLEELEKIPVDKLLDQRYRRLMGYGNFTEA